MNRKENRSSWLNETENKADDQQMPRLRFHENPSFEKITKNRCSGAWINGFSFFGAWNLTGCLYFYLRLWKKVHTLAKKQK